MKKQKIAVVMDSYFPNSRATTYIMQNILENLPDHFEIFVFVLSILHKEPDDLPKEHNGIRIVYVDPYVNKKTLRGFWLKLKSKIIIPMYKAKYNVSYYYDTLYLRAKQLEKLFRKMNITEIVSVSSPTDVHICTEMVLSRHKDYKWYAFSYDPHSHNNDYPEAFRKKLEYEELKLYKKAKSVFMLKQSETDYKTSPLYDKITFFDIPIIEKNTLANKSNRETNRIKIMYVGNLYYSIRNPEYMFDLFGKTDLPDYTLYVIGTFSGWSESDLDAFKKKLNETFGDKLIIIDRLNRHEIKDYLSDADFFVNLGNLTENQCPSKVIDYISTGKPIIHFKKIDNCSSMSYLSKYPNVCVIDERDPKETSILKLEQFITSNYGKTVSSELLKDLYKENDIKYISNLLASQIEAK